MGLIRLVIVLRITLLYEEKTGCCRTADGVRPDDTYITGSKMGKGTSKDRYLDKNQGEKI